MQLRQLSTRFDRLWARLPRWASTSLLWAAAIVPLCVVYGPALVEHIGHSANPLTYNDDVRILNFPFFHYSDRALFAHDPISEYMLDALPEGYRMIFISAAYLWNPGSFAKLVPYLLLLVILGSCAAAANKIAGKPAAFAAMALTLGSGLFLARMAGTMPRAFAYPLIAATIAALAYGRAWWVAALVVVGAGFYPVTAVVIGFSLAGMLLLLPADDRGSASDWSLKRRFVFLCGTAGAAALVLAPTVWRLRKWGAQITPDMFQRFPESGPGGRFGGIDHPPFPPFIVSAHEFVRDTLLGTGKPLLESARKWLEHGHYKSHREAVLELLLVIVVLGWAQLAWTRAEARRVLLLVASALFGHAISLPITPHFFLPQRYVQYTVPVVVIVLTATAFGGLWSAIARSQMLKRVAPVFVLSANIGVLLLVGSRGSPNAGMDITLNSGQTQLYDKLATLPKDAVIAGWPPELDNVPYVARREVFLSQETHVPFHVVFTELTRQRMEAVIDAYFATSVEPLERLHRLGASYFLVDLRYLRRPPGYFRPFGRDIQVALGRARGRPFEVNRQIGPAGVYRQGDLVLLDLSRLAH